ncbi:MAG: 5'-nucleotidase C-terminal domain-containing protein [Fimbriimonadaceae bacterium]
MMKGQEVLCPATPMRTTFVTVILFALVSTAFCGPDTESFGPGQAIADEIKAVSGADIAWIPAAMLEDEAKGDLGSYLKFGTDEISVVSLTGEQIKLALERSVNLYPTPNPSFLQVAGLEVSFSKSAAPDSRIRTVLVNGIELNFKQNYDVAMPITIARGGLGFFTVWKKTSITRTMEGTTLEKVLKGKSGFVRTARWKAVD